MNGGWEQGASRRGGRPESAVKLRPGCTGLAVGALAGVAGVALRLWPLGLPRPPSFFHLARRLLTSYVFAHRPHTQRRITIIKFWAHLITTVRYDQSGVGVRSVHSYYAEIDTSQGVWGAGKNMANMATTYQEVKSENDQHQSCKQVDIKVHASHTPATESGSKHAFAKKGTHGRAWAVVVNTQI